MENGELRRIMAAVPEDDWRVKSDVDVVWRTQSMVRTGEEIVLRVDNGQLYWLALLYQGKYIDKQSFESIGSHSEELIELLTATVKTSKAAKRPG